MVAGGEWIVENGCEIAAALNRCLGDNLTLVDDFKLRTRLRLAGNHGRTIRLDAQNVEGRKLGRIARGCRCRWCCGLCRRLGRLRCCGRRFRSRGAIIRAGEHASKTADLSCGRCGICRQAAKIGRGPLGCRTRSGDQTRGRLIERFRNVDVFQLAKRVFDLLAGGSKLFIGGHLAVGKEVAHVLDGLVGGFRQAANLFGNIGRVLGGIRQKIARLFTAHLDAVLDGIAGFVDGVADRLVITGHARKNEEDHEQRGNAEHDKRQQSSSFIFHYVSPDHSSQYYRGLLAF